MTRWQELKAKYGLFGAIQPYFFGEKPPTLTEHQAKIRWYVQALIYATSLATLFVFGVGEIDKILTTGWTVLSIILAIPLVLVLIMVYAMDRSSAMTIPRIPLLARREQWGLFAEHIAYALCVGAVWAFTYGLVIYTIENDIQALIDGRSIVPPGLIWIVGLVIARAILLVWTIWHAHFSSEELPVQWGTVERELTRRIGGSIMEDIGKLDFTEAPLDVKLQIQAQLLSPSPKAPWQWSRRLRREAQARLDLTHRQEVIAAVKDIYQREGLIALPQEAVTAVVDGATTVVEEPPFIPQLDAPSEAAVMPGARSTVRPKPSTLAFRQYVRAICKRMLEDRQQITIYTLAQQAECSREELLAAIKAIVEQARKQLRPNQQVTDTVILHLAALYESQPAEA